MMDKIPYREYKSRDWIGKLNEYIEQGYIWVASHPTKPLKIYNYTQKTQFEGFWNEITMACRGLVLDDEYAVIIKCPKKFFNQGEPYAEEVNLKNAYITEKLDGYYISVRYDSKYGLIITSRGSFDNTYVDAAKKLLEGKQFIADDSYFFELCQNFPGDEGIIVARHETPKIAMWGKRDNYNVWKYNLMGEEWLGFEVAHWFSPFTDELKRYLEGDVEGVVAIDLDTYKMVKIKTGWYLERHRMISDCTKKRVWEILRNGERVCNQNFPDEMIPQMVVWENELIEDLRHQYAIIDNLKYLWENMDKKQIALCDRIPLDYKPYLYYMKDGNQDRAKEFMFKKIIPKFA